MKKMHTLRTLTKLFFGCFITVFCLSTTSCKNRHEGEIELKELNKKSSERSNHENRDRHSEAINSNESGGRSNSEAVAKLEAEVNAAKARLPMDVDDMTKCTGISYNGGKVVYTLVIDESAASIADLSENKSAMRSFIENGLKGQPIVTMCINAGAGIVYLYKGDTSGETMTIRFSCNDLKNL